MTIPLWARWKAFKVRVSNKLFRFMLWRTAKRLSWSCRLWDLRGLPDCPYHGIHAQSWWTGYCKECGEKPSIPPMEATCTFCGEEKAVKQRANPNGGKEIWGLCWECNEYIDWSFENSWCMQAEAMGLKGKMVKPFDEWLFDKHQVYPKGDYTQIVIKKKTE